MEDQILIIYEGNLPSFYFSILIIEQTKICKIFQTIQYKMNKIEYRLTKKEKKK